MVWNREMAMWRRFVAQNDMAARLVAGPITDALERTNGILAGDERKPTQG